MMGADIYEECPSNIYILHKKIHLSRQSLIFLMLLKKSENKINQFF